MRGEDRGRQCPRTGTGETPPRAWGRLESSLDGEILRGNVRGEDSVPPLATGTT